MLKTVVKALEGFEQEYELVSAKKANLEAEKQVAIDAAIAEVEARYELKSKKIDEVLAELSETYEVEVPDEEEVVEETAETTEEVSVDNTISF